MVGERSPPPPAIGGYTPIQRVSSGGYGDVYLYDEPRLNRKVAIKVIRDPLADPHVRQRFETEAHTMAKLEHPHVVRIYGTGTTDAGQPFISMMFCPNATMAERCVREHMSVDEVLRIGIAMSGALESAHRAGILHRDVKPANILTTPWDEPGLSDFGVAANAAAADDGDIGVSIPWSPPEMLLGRAKGSPGTDVYSLGATVWTLLVGRSPFEIPRGDNSRMALIGRISNAPVPRTGRIDVPPVLEQILARSMAKDPGQRFRSAADFGRALQSVEIRLQRPVSNMVVLGTGSATEARSWPREEALWLSGDDDDPAGTAWPSRPYPLATESSGGLSPSGPGGQGPSGGAAGAAAFGGWAAGAAAIGGQGPGGPFSAPGATGGGSGAAAGWRTRRQWAVDTRGGRSCRDVVGDTFWRARWWGDIVVRGAFRTAEWSCTWLVVGPGHLHRQHRAQVAGWRRRAVGDDVTADAPGQSRALGDRRPGSGLPGGGNPAGLGRPRAQASATSDHGGGWSGHDEHPFGVFRRGREWHAERISAGEHAHHCYLDLPAHEHVDGIAASTGPDIVRKRVPAVVTRHHESALGRDHTRDAGKHPGTADDQSRLADDVRAGTHLRVRPPSGRVPGERLDVCR